MLCPKCGTEVGDTPELCDRCAAQEAEAKVEETPSEDSETLEDSQPEEEDASEAEEQEEPEPEEDTETEVDEAVAEKKEEVASGSPARRLLIVVLLVLFGIIVGVGYFLYDRGIDIQSLLEPEETPKGDQLVSKPVSGGSVQVADKTLSLETSFVLYDPIKNRLEIGFFHNVPRNTVAAQARTTRSLTELTSIRPDVLFVLNFQFVAEACSRDLITEFKVGILGNPGRFPDDLQLDLAEQLGGITSLTCQLSEGADVQAKFKDELRVGDQTVVLDLLLHDKIVVVKTQGSVRYSSRDAKATLALWDKKKGKLEVGFFPSRVSARDMAAMRKNKSLVGIPDRSPSVVASMELQKGARRLDLSSMIQYGVTFYRDPQLGILFPGAKDYVGFFYVVGTDKTRQISKLRGFLRDNDLIEGKLAHAEKKDIRDIPFQFSWDLDFDAAVMDVYGEGGDEDEDEGLSKKRKGPYAQITAGRAVMEAKTVLGLYYPSEADLAVGFYGFDLSDSEKEQVRRNRVLWAYVNHKRPNMVLFFNFNRSANQASLEDLLEYTIYFYRDKIGSFHFPGQFDSRSVKRLKVELGEKEIQELSGRLEDNGVVQLKLKGKHVSKRIGERFSWDVNISAQILEVK